MRGNQKLCSLSAAEGSGWRTMEGPNTQPQEKDYIGKGMKPSPSQSHNEASPPPSPQPPKAEKRVRRSAPSPAGPYFQPLPTIETIMTYPSLSRPVYDRLLRGEPPAKNYNTVIHTPKPPNMRTLDQNLLHAAEVQAYRRKKRSRSNTTSTTGSSASAYSAGDDSTASSITSSVAGDSDTSTSDMSEPSSPASISSTSKATVASSPPGTPHWSLFPPLASPTPSTESSIINAYSDPPSRVSSPSPAQSFHSTLSTLSMTSDSASEVGAPSSTRSSAPSPASSAYPSPPTSPQQSRRSSSSGEEFMYPSPPPSPHVSRTQRSQIQHRERRAFTFPPPLPSVVPTPPASATRLTRSTSLSSHPYSETEFMGDAEEFDLGEQMLGGGSSSDEDEDGLDWSMNGGEVVFVGAAGVAMSPRAMKGDCCACGGRGLGLYVIDEEAEEEARNAVEQ